MKSNVSCIWIVFCCRVWELFVLPSILSIFPHSLLGNSSIRLSFVNRTIQPFEVSDSAVSLHSQSCATAAVSKPFLITPKGNPAPFEHHVPVLHSIPLSPRQPLIGFLPLWICPFWAFYINDVIPYVVFHDWLLPLSGMFSGFTQRVVTHKTTSLHFTAK